MSWLFSRALVEEYSAGTCLDTNLSVQLSVMPTQHPFLRNDKTMDVSRLSRFGQTCAALTEDHGKALLTSFLEASRAKTSVSQDLGKELRGQDQAYGVKWQELSVRYDLGSSMWKTHRSLWEEDLPWSSVILPRWGLMRSGVVYQHPTSERPISATEYGSLLPTLTVCGNYNRKGASETSGDGLATALLRMMPTLVARDFRTPGKSRLERTGSKSGDHLPNIVGGPLNPDWCEWFMGFPIGWTALKPLEMHKFQEWRQQHSICSANDGSTTTPT